MCVQDQRMAAFGTLRRQAITSVAGDNRLPDMSRALWFSLTDSFQAAVPVYVQAGGGNQDYIPRDARYVMFNGQQSVYSREQCGSAFSGPLFFGSGGGLPYYLTWLELDIGTYSDIVSPNG